MRRSRWHRGVLVAMVAPALAFATATSATAATYQPLSPSPCGTMSVDDGLAHQIDHVVWVVFENKARSVVFGDPTKDPYLGGLALACGQANAYLATPFYGAKMAMASGSDWGITGDVAKVAGPDLYSQLGTDWMQYMGGMPSNCYGLNTKDKLYLAAHNAAAYFTDAADACRTQDVPVPATPAELDLSHKFTYIEANVPQSMHGCNKICGKNKWAQLVLGDAWAKVWVDALVKTPEYLSGSTVIFVAWDQSTALAGNRAAFITVSPYTTPGQVSTVDYTHYSLLRGTEDLLGLDPLGHAADPTTNSVANDFGLPYPAVFPPPLESPLRHRSSR
jgi:phosphatidylinositol-3-phosphatase